MRVALLSLILKIIIKIKIIKPAAISSSRFCECASKHHEFRLKQYKKYKMCNLIKVTFKEIDKKAKL